MKKLTYVSPEAKYAMVEDDIFTTGSFDASMGENESDVGGIPGFDITPDQ